MDGGSFSKRNCCDIPHFEMVLEKHCDEKTKNMGCNPKFILIFCYLRDHIIKKSRIQIKYVQFALKPTFKDILNRYMG